MTTSAPTVVVHGPPGAGKSTLAVALGRELDVPCFDRDEFKDVMFDQLGYTDREWSRNVGVASWNLLTMVATRLLLRRIPFVVESNFMPDSPAVTAIREAAKTVSRPVLGVFVTAEAETLWERFDERARSGGRHPGHVGFDERDEFLQALRGLVFGPISFGGPVMTIDTTTRWPDPVALASELVSGLCS